MSTINQDFEAQTKTYNNGLNGHTLRMPLESNLDADESKRYRTHAAKTKAEFELLKELYKHKGDVVPFFKLYAVEHAHVTHHLDEQQIIQITLEELKQTRKKYEQRGRDKHAAFMKKKANENKQAQPIEEQTQPPKPEPTTEPTAQQSTAPKYFYVPRALIELEKETRPTRRAILFDEALREIGFKQTQTLNYLASLEI